MYEEPNAVIMQYHIRRRQLAQLGSATGVYKTLVKYLVGVPQVGLVASFRFIQPVCWDRIDKLKSSSLFG